MTRRSLASVLLLALALTALLLPSAAAARTIVLQSDERATVESLQLDPGDEVGYSWDASGLVEFRVRNENYGFTVLELTDSARSGTFVAPLAGTYTFRFENVQDYAITVTYSISQGGFLLILAAIGLVAALAVLAVVVVWYLSRRRRQMMPPPPYAPPPYAPPPQPPQT